VGLADNSLAESFAPVDAVARWRARS